MHSFIVSCIYLLFVDIDECDNGEAICEHDCENLPGTFQCVCNTGYLLAHDSISCEGKCNECHPDHKLYSLPECN